MATNAKDASWGLLFLAQVVSGFLTGPVWAADPLGRILDQEITQSLRLRAGQSKVLRLPVPLTCISVANPAVSDIILQPPEAAANAYDKYNKSFKSETKGTLMPMLTGVGDAK
jgi:Flp pilus assembly secretin CpaC